MLSQISTALVALLAICAPVAVDAALFEPAGNQVLLGAWIDTTYDTPFAYNARAGQNISMFQVAQQIPLPAYNYVTADTRLTHADPTTFNIAATDYSQLAQQILNYTSVYNRSVFLRFAPEMQGASLQLARLTRTGQWMTYGFQPSKFIPMWQTMYTTLKAAVPSGLAIVWAPNTGQSYPYGQTTNVAADLRLLDTNGDGQVTAADDAFSPYYPGDAYVDWIGMSVYFKGTNNQNTPVQEAGFCGYALDNINPNTLQAAGPSNFYQTCVCSYFGPDAHSYCAAKPQVACMFAESGAAYHTEATGGIAAQLAIQQAWMSGCTFNETFYDTYPRLKAFFQFEHAKEETDGGIADFRDYRVTNQTQVLAAFQSHLSAGATRFQLATPTTLPLGLQTTGRPANLPGGDGSNGTTSAVGIVFQTQRVFDIGPPSLFGATAGAQRALQAATASIFAGLAGGAALLISRRRAIVI